MVQLKFNLSKVNANWKITKNFFVSYELLKIFDAKNPINPNPVIKKVSP